MNLDPDVDLLATYADTLEEAAFAAFVARRIDGVYAVALRRLAGDAHLAEEVTQSVFTAVATNARRLARHPDLTGWLYITARHMAANAVRAERRRKARETKAHVMATLSASEPIDWTRVAPILDDAIEQLGPIDRTAVILRFIEQRAYAEIGAALKLSEDAARMRIDRALDKLRQILEGRGVASTTAALAAALANQALGAAPAHLAGAVTNAAVAAGSVSAVSANFNTLVVMTKMKIAITGFAAVIAALLAIREVRAGRELEAEARQLQRQETKLAQGRAADAQRIRDLQALASEHPEAGELARVRQRLALLRSRPEGVVDEAMRPIGSYRNRGWASPRAAYETFQWARATGNADEFETIYGWTPAGKAKVDRFFAGLPENLRAEYGTPERMLALADAPFRYDPNEPVAVQILGQDELGSEVLVHGWWRLRSGREVDGTLLFQRVGDRWCIPFTDEQTDRELAKFDPATGRLRTMP